jgi:hypothetical protein
VRVILVVLALIWVLALTPTLLRKLAERESTYSVAKFHRSLRVMRQTYPGQVAAMGGGLASGGQFAPGRVGPFVGGHTAAGYPAGRPVAARASGHSTRRRRQVLLVLGAGLVVTFLIGLVPGLSVLWAVSLLLLAVTAGYVALLIHFRRAELERAQKVVHLQRAAALSAEPAAAGVATAEVTAEVPAVASFGVPAHRVSRVRTSGPVRILTDRHETRTPAVVGG